MTFKTFNKFLFSTLTMFLLLSSSLTASAQDFIPFLFGPSSGENSFIIPTKGEVVNTYKAGHYAVDIANSSKPDIFATADGKVVKVSTGTWGGGYGNHIIIDHSNGFRSLYAHLDCVKVKLGQDVRQGDKIGVMGNTGRVYGSTGIHLHWELILDGVKVNPLFYAKERKKEEVFMPDSSVFRPEINISLLTINANLLQANK